MNVQVKKPEEKKVRPFPKLMISRHTGRIIYALRVTESGSIEGIPLTYPEGSFPKGRVYSSFDRYGFEDFEGSVTLSND